MRLVTTMSHNGFASKKQSVGRIESGGLETLNFKAGNLIPGDDFPDFLFRSQWSRPLEERIAR